MKEFKVGDLYYYKDTKTILKILDSIINFDFVIAEVLFTDVNVFEKGSIGYFNVNSFYNKVEKQIKLSL